MKTSCRRQKKSQLSQNDAGITIFTDNNFFYFDCNHTIYVRILQKFLHKFIPKSFEKFISKNFKTCECLRISLCFFKDVFTSAFARQPIIVQ